MNLDLDLRGDAQVRAMFRRLNDQAGQRALAATVVDSEDYVEAEAGRHTKTGALVQSIYKSRIREMAWELGHNRQQAPQAVFVHWGTRPHVIRPKGKKALRWAAGGRFFFARAVNHPGYRGDPWLTRAAARAPALFRQHVETTLRQLQR